MKYFGILFATALALAAAQPLTNQNVIRMIQAGVPSEVVLKTIRSADSCEFSMLPGELMALGQAKVPEEVVKAMAARINNVAPTINGAPTVAEADRFDLTAPPIDIGVYYKDGAEWQDLPGEVVNYKTGGIIKHALTFGIVKGDVNAHVNRGKSIAQQKSGIDLLVRTPEGVSINEYQLLRLRTHHGSREFRTITGGVLHVSGGEARDAKPFVSKKIAPRTYEIKFDGLKPGEYGLLPPPDGDAAAARGRIASVLEPFSGKIYSFRILE